MKQCLPLGIKTISILFCIHFSFTVFGQATRSVVEPELQFRKAKILFDARQYDALESYISALISSPAASATFSQWELDELNFMQLISGVVLHQETMIAKAIELMETSPSRNTQVKLSYHLGHHFFTIGEYDKSIDYLEKSDPLYLSNEENERIQFEKGVSYFAQKKFDNAKPYLRSLDQLNSSVYQDDVKYYLGFIAFSEKKYEEAGAFFKQIESSSTYSKVIPFYQACIAQATGNYSRAITYGEKYLKGGDEIHVKQVSLLLASAYYNTGDFSRSVRLFKQAMEGGAELSNVQHFELGAGYYATGQYLKAIEELKPLSTSGEPIGAKAMLVLGNSYLQAGQKANARSAFQICVSTLEPGEQLENVRFQLAKLSLEMGYEDMAIQELSRIVKDQRQSVHAKEASNILIVYYARTNNYRQALDLIQNGNAEPSAVQKVAPRIYYGRGVELINDLQYDDAEKMLAAVSSFKNSTYYPPSLFWRGEIASRKDQFSAVIRFTQDYLKLRQSDFGTANESNANYNLGYAYLDTEDFKSAAIYFERIMLSKIQLSNDFRREATLRYADCLFMLKNIDKARNLYQSMKDKPGYGADYAGFQIALIEGAKYPDKKIDHLRSLEVRYPQSELMPLICMELADTYMSEEQYDKSIPYLKRMASLVGSDDDRMPESIMKLAIAYYNLNQTEQSIASYKKLIQDYPVSEYAQEALESVKSLYVESGRIGAYESFLNSTGRTVDQLQKDSLTFQYVQTVYSEGNNLASRKVLDEYENTFPEGLFIADVLNYKAEIYLREKDWKKAADVLEKLGSKGPSKYQEKALRQAGKLHFFDLKDYESAQRVFANLIAVSSNPEVILEAVRGEVRSFYYLKRWGDGRSSAATLLQNQVATQDDKSFAHMILGYSDQLAGSWNNSTVNFKAVTENNNAALGAEARFQLAKNQFFAGNLSEAERLATIAIDKSGSYEYWITRSYLLLGEIFLEQKDFFNAKATLKSIVDNCSIIELRQEAANLLTKIEKTEKDAKSN
jgi:tetratricopeptide (TPR) repeat protein